MRVPDFLDRGGQQVRQRRGVQQDTPGDGRRKMMHQPGHVMSAAAIDPRRRGRAIEHNGPLIAAYRVILIDAPGSALGGVGDSHSQFLNLVLGSRNRM